MCIFWTVTEFCIHSDADKLISICLNFHVKYYRCIFIHLKLRIRVVVESKWEQNTATGRGKISHIAHLKYYICFVLFTFQLIRVRAPSILSSLQHSLQWMINICSFALSHYFFSAFPTSISHSNMTFILWLDHCTISAA